jgi:hypothetical protein
MSIVLFVFKPHNISETEFYLCLVTLEDRERIQSPKPFVLEQDDE